MENLLIIEDERPAFEKMKSYLSEILDHEFRYDWAKSLSETRAYLENSSSYTLIIADIQLQNDNVFDLFSKQLLGTPIIFCTAYNEYLSKAFNTTGIGYLMKPYSREDLRTALNKYQLLFRDKDDSEEIIVQIQAAIKGKKKTRSRFICKNHKNEMQIVDCDLISVIEASGDFCLLKTLENKTFTYSEQIGRIESQLDPELFFKINRSQIINLKLIEKMTPYFKNRIVISLKGNKDKFITSSSKTAEFRKWLSN